MKNVIIEAVTLGGLRSNLAVPWPIGNIAPREETDLNAHFAADNFSPGVNYPLAVTGSFRVGATDKRFSITTNILVPNSGPSPVQLLSGNVTVDVDDIAGIWTYTVSNTEPSDSNCFINTLSLKVPAPLTVLSSPDGWDAQTDGHSYVLWYAKDVTPTGKLIPPGKRSIGNFAIQSTSRRSEGTRYALTSWSPPANKVERAGLGTVLAPARRIVEP